MARQRGAKQVARHTEKETVRVVRGLHQPDEQRRTMVDMARRIQDLTPKATDQQDEPNMERSSRWFNRPVGVVRYRR